jgi:hypothetical protein
MGQVPVSPSAAATPDSLAARQPPHMMNLRKITTPLLLHLLRGQMRFPRLFLLRCRLTVGRFKRRIDPRFPGELVDLVGLPFWVYLNLKHRLGQAKAFEIMRVAILTGGIAQWNLAYQTVDMTRTFANLCDLELEVNKTGPTRWNTLEIVDRSDRRFEIKITRCLYHQLATSVGIPEVTPIVCQIDNAAFNAYLPDRVTFNRGGPGNRIADGNSQCRFVWEVNE